MGSAPALRRCSIRAGRVVAHYLTEREHPILSRLLEEYVACIGQPRRCLDARRRTESADSNQTAQVLAVAVLDAEFGTEVRAAVAPRRARAVTFALAADRRPRLEAMAVAACELGVSVEELDHALLADLPAERFLVAPEPSLTAAGLALRCNAMIHAALLHRSTRVVIELTGNARPVVRQALLRGLICTVYAPAPGAPTRMEVSGPLSLLRRTTRYGRSLAELVPLLAWCERFRLTAHCIVHGQAAAAVVSSTDPVQPATEPRAYDSALERRFARDFLCRAPDWDLVREPEPVVAGRRLIFPDFLLRHRREPTRTWWLEIAGFWTSDYLERKLASLRAAGLHRLILCIDEERNCGDEDLPDETVVVRFRRRIDVDAVLRVLGEAG